MKHLKESTLWKYANGEDLEKSVEAHRELDRRFYLDNPQAFIDKLEAEDRELVEQERVKYESDGMDGGYCIHDSRE